MEYRHLLAYALILLMIGGAATWIAYARHNTRDRKIARQRAHDAERMGKR